MPSEKAPRKCIAPSGCSTNVGDFVSPLGSSLSSSDGGDYFDEDFDDARRSYVLTGLDEHCDLRGGEALADQRPAVLPPNAKALRPMAAPVQPTFLEMPPQADAASVDAWFGIDLTGSPCEEGVAQGDLLGPSALLRAVLHDIHSDIPQHNFMAVLESAADVLVACESSSFRSPPRGPKLSFVSAPPSPPLFPQLPRAAACTDDTFWCGSTGADGAGDFKFAGASETLVAAIKAAVSMSPGRMPVEAEGWGALEEADDGAEAFVFAMDVEEDVGAPDQSSFQYQLGSLDPKYALESGAFFGSSGVDEGLVRVATPPDLFALWGPSSAAALQRRPLPANPPRAPVLRCAELDFNTLPSLSLPPAAGTGDEALFGSRSDAGSWGAQPFVKGFSEQLWRAMALAAADLGNDWESGSELGRPWLIEKKEDHDCGVFDLDGFSLSDSDGAAYDGFDGQAGAQLRPRGFSTRG